jgi:hypothetical protein
MQPITPASPGQPLRASDINAQSSELRRQGNTFFEGGTLSQEAGGVHLSADAPSGFWAALTGRDRYKYSWRQVQKTNNGNWDYTQTNTQSGSTNLNFAFEANYSIAVPIGTTVWLTFHSSIIFDDSPCNIYVFTFAEGGGYSYKSSVVTDVTNNENGIALTKQSFQAYHYNVNFSPTILACSDLIPKSLIGQANKVITVNSNETGFDFGASVAPFSGTSSFNASITSLTNSITSLQTSITNLTSQLAALATRVANLESKVP